MHVILSHSVSCFVSLAQTCDQAPLSNVTRKFKQKPLNQKSFSGSSLFNRFECNNVQFSCAFQQLLHSRRLTNLKYLTKKYFLRFDGSAFQTEASSNFPHYLVGTLGSYRDSPFITGGYHNHFESIPNMRQFSTSGLKTEVLNYGTSTWVEADDYPYSTGDKYVL